MGGGRHQRARRGFSVIEVIVATGLFALFAVVIGQAVYNVLVATQPRERAEEALEQDIRFVMRQVLQTGSIDELEQGDYVETLTHGRVDWRAEAELMEVVDLHELRVTLEFSDPAVEPRERELVRYVLRPGWTDPAERSDLLQRKEEALSSLRMEPGL